MFEIVTIIVFLSIGAMFYQANGGLHFFYDSAVLLRWRIPVLLREVWILDCS